ncbi:hypothetical protein BASA81_011286 [Batrachochytrium salamandrivorans]|nr:hypothetical protein BASA81_011286 [Batrachochytrium salamandrivorans]
MISKWLVMGVLGLALGLIFRSFDEPLPPSTRPTTVLPSRSALLPSNVMVGLDEVNEIGQRPLNNSKRLAFSLHPNGDGRGRGLLLHTSNYSDVDAIISKHCCLISDLPDSRCEANSGARLINSAGVRVLSFNDLDHNQRVYCVPNSLHFVWPNVGTGYEFYPKNVVSVKPDMLPIKLTQLSEDVRVFSVENFVSQEELAELFKTNQDRVERSLLGPNRTQNTDRTSNTAWDSSSLASATIIKRTFQVLGMDFGTSDSVQVLQYEPGKFYKPHMDWFSGDYYQDYDPVVNNGTNRFATMFLYLNTVQEGGHTVFPRSTTHEGFNGEHFAKQGPKHGFTTEEFTRACDPKGSALKGQPVAGNAVLFYSQGPDSRLDYMSLHGGCPPLSGEKWSANVWIYNRPKASPESYKFPQTKKSEYMQAKFENKLDLDLELLWDSNGGAGVLNADLDAATKVFVSTPDRFHLQGSIPRGGELSRGSLGGHVFVAVNPTNKQVHWVGQVPPEVATHTFAVL